MFKTLGSKRHMTIRLLDPQLHEFLPEKETLIAEVAGMKARNEDTTKKEELLHIAETLPESNPMMGLRGCRLGLTYLETNEVSFFGNLFSLFVLYNCTVVDFL